MRKPARRRSSVINRANFTRQVNLQRALEFFQRRVLRTVNRKHLLVDQHEQSLQQAARRSQCTKPEANCLGDAE